MIEFMSYIKDSMFINNVILLTFFVGFLTLFFKESMKEESPLNWVDAFIDKKTGKLSLSQLGQFCGIAIGGWMMIYMVQVKEGYNALTLLFPAWLAFLSGSYAFSKYINRVESKDKDKEEK